MTDANLLREKNTIGWLVDKPAKQCCRGGVCSSGRATTKSWYDGSAVIGVLGMEVREEGRGSMSTAPGAGSGDGQAV